MGRILGRADRLTAGGDHHNDAIERGLGNSQELHRYLDDGGCINLGGESGEWDGDDVIGQVPCFGKKNWEKREAETHSDAQVQGSRVVVREAAWVSVAGFINVSVVFGGLGIAERRVVPREADLLKVERSLGASLGSLKFSDGNCIGYWVAVEIGDLGLVLRVGAPGDGLLSAGGVQEESEF